MAEGYATAEDGVRLYCVTKGSGSEVIVCPNGPALMDDLAPVSGGRTMVCYDPRNRGRSDPAGDARPARGVHDDVEDLEAVRRHFGAPSISLVGHSYLGLMAALYAMRYPERVSRLVMIGPAEPLQGKPYPPQLCNHDQVFRDTMTRLGAFQAESASLTPAELCRKFWSILTPLYVFNPAHVDRIHWSRCDDTNEVGFMRVWTGTILPSLRDLQWSPEQVSRAGMPVLIVHGRQDRSAPYGGALDWAALLPNARLLTVNQAAHAPWLEQPDEVLGPLATFLSGEWPSAAEVI